MKGNYDFIGMASDGIFEKLTNEDFVQCVWNSVNDGDKAADVHK